MNPLASIGCARQTTFFVPWRDWQGQENFILHQLHYIQFTLYRQEIPGVVFQFVLRHVGALRNQLQQTIDIKIKRNGFQATLAGQGQNPGHFQMQQRFPAYTSRSLKAKSNLSRYFSQQVVQPLKR